MRIALLSLSFLFVACGAPEGAPLPQIVDDGAPNPQKLPLTNPFDDVDDAHAGDDDHGIDDDDSAFACEDVSCGPDAICRVDDDGPFCAPTVCSDSAPADGCEATCASGYAVSDGVTTCGCCDIAVEPTFTTCFDDKDCTDEQRCDHRFCESTCPDGMACPAVCAGRCHAQGLVPVFVDALAD